MALATLSIDLEAKLAKLQEGMDKAGRLAEIQAARIDKAFAGIRNTAASLGSAIAGAFVVDGISAFVRRTIDGIDALNDLADASGASVENISALEDIAARTGTSFDTVGAALVKFNAGLKETNPNSPAALALKQIGLNAEELRRIDPAEALKRTAAALAGYADDGDKARLVQELFGKSVKEVAPFLRDLADAGGLNATVTTKQAKEAEAFNKQIFELQKNLTDLSRVMVGPVVSGFNDLIERFRMASREGRSFYSVITEQYRRSNGTMPIVGATAEDAARLTDSQRRAIEDRGFNPFAKSVGPLPASGGGAKAKAAAFVDYAQEVQQAVAKMVTDTDIVRIAELNDQLEEHKHHGRRWPGPGHRQRRAAPAPRPHGQAAPGHYRAGGFPPL